MCGYYVIPEKCIPKIQGVLLVHDWAHGLFQPTSLFEYGDVRSNVLWLCFYRLMPALKVSFFYFSGFYIEFTRTG